MVGITDAERSFSGRYRILASLGAGSCASVFLAEDIALNRRVTLKVFAEELAADGAFLARFEAVAASAVALSHPRVAAVYEWGQQPLCHLAMEYLAGGSLQAMLDAGRLLSRSQALMVGLETARALECIHSQGFAHFGVKPSNLLFDEQGRLHLADFGLAGALAEAGRADAYGYAAPEQSHGEPLSAPYDVYCLALTMAEAVTGESPSAAADGGSVGPEAGTSTGAKADNGPIGSEAEAEADSTQEASVSAVSADAGGGVPDIADDDLLVTHPGIPSRFRSALGPLWYALDRVTEPASADRPSAAKVAGELLSAAEMLPRPAPLPLAGAEAAACHVRPRGAGPADEASPSESSDASAPIARRAKPRRSDATADRWPLPPSSSSQADSPSEGPSEASEGPSSGSGGADAHAGPIPAWSLSEQAGILPDDPFQRRWPGWIIALVAVLACAGFGLRALLDDRASRHRVPDLAGVTCSEAWLDGLASSHRMPDRAAAICSEELAFMSEFGWEAEESLVRVKGTEPGEIVAVEPPPGARLASGETLKLSVSLGEPLVLVPDLYALSVEDATAGLEDIRLTVADPADAERVHNELVPVGFTVGLDLPAGVHELESGSEVRLLISAGPADRPVPHVPSGRSVIAAEQALRDVRLVPGAKVEALSSEVPEGQVVGFDPHSGTVAQPGSVVDMIVSRGWSQVEIPVELLGLEVAAVAEQLETAGFEVEVDGTGGTVVAINLTPGELHLVALLGEDQRVDLVPVNPAPGGLYPYGARVVVTTGEPAP